MHEITHENAAGGEASLASGTQSVAIGRRDVLIMWGVTAGKVGHNTSNARAVTAGKIGRNSSKNNNKIQHL